jgi:hypothetical protein
MSNSEPILSEFLTTEELAAELRRNKRALDRWAVLGTGPPRTYVGCRNACRYRGENPSEFRVIISSGVAFSERRLVCAKQRVGNRHV